MATTSADTCLSLHGHLAGSTSRTRMHKPLRSGVRSTCSIGENQGRARTGLYPRLLLPRYPSRFRLAASQWRHRMHLRTLKARCMSPDHVVIERFGTRGVIQYYNRCAMQTRSIGLGRSSTVRGQLYRSRTKPSEPANARAITRVTWARRAFSPRPFNCCRPIYRAY